MPPIRHQFACILALSAPLAASENDPAFTGLGHLDGSSKTSTAFGISSDGTTICGESLSSKGTEAFRWREASGIEGIGDLPNSPFKSSARGLSSDGSFIAGHGSIGLSNVRAARWVGTATPTNIGNINSTGFKFSDANGVSNDGKKIVGTSTSSKGPRAFLWTSKTGGAAGTMKDLGVVQTGNNMFSSASAITGDGSKVIGASTYQITETTTNPDGSENITIIEQGTEAFYYTALDRITGLGDLEGGNLGSEALAITDDGDVIVGYGESDEGIEGVIWVDTQIQSVGDLAGGDTNCRLTDVSASGNEAVGTGSDVTGQVAVIWDAANGLRKLSNVLDSVGVDLAGWTLLSAAGISSDADVLVGNGINPEGEPEGWRLSGALNLFLPVPPITELNLEVGRTVSIETEPGNIYQIEVSQNLGDWSPLGPAHSTNGASNESSFAVIDPSSTASRFYRSRLLPGSNLATAPNPVVSDGVVVGFSSSPGFVYRVEGSSNLSSWNNVIPALDTSADEVPLLHSISDDTFRFFRLTVENAP